jgi:hypothetical protein
MAKLPSSAKELLVGSPFYSYREVGAILGLKPRRNANNHGKTPEAARIRKTVQRLVKPGQLETVRVGGQDMVTRESLARVYAGQSKAPPRFSGAPRGPSTSHQQQLESEVEAAIDEAFVTLRSAVREIVQRWSVAGVDVSDKRRK